MEAMPAGGGYGGPPGGYGGPPGGYGGPPGGYGGPPGGYGGPPGGYGGPPGGYGGTPEILPPHPAGPPGFSGFTEALRSGRRWVSWFHVFGPVLRLGLVALAVLLVIAGGRSFLDSLLVRLDRDTLVHNDRSEAQIKLQRAVPDRIALTYAQEDGSIRRVLVERNEYTDFMRQLFTRLEGERVRLVSAVPERLRAASDPVFREIQGNVDPYADWYFSQWTTYQLLYVGLQAFAQNQAMPTAASAKDMAAAEISKYIHEHFRDLVLKPEINDFKMRKAFESTFEALHKDYVRALGAADQEFLRFVARKVPYVEPGHDPEPTLELDWASNLNKLSLSLHDKGGIGAVARGAAAAGIGAKLAAPAMALALAGKKAVVALGAKLAAPFMTKVATTVGASAAAGAVGMAAGPAAPIAAPVLFVGGAALSLAADYLVNEADEKRNRPLFVRDVNASVRAIEDEWVEVMRQPLEQALGVWFDDTLNLLSDYRK